MHYTHQLFAFVAHEQGSRHAAQDALNRPRELLNCPSLEITMQLGMDELAEYLRVREG